MRVAVTGKGTLAVGVDGLPPSRSVSTGRTDLLGRHAELSGGLGDVAGVAGESDGLAFELGRVLLAGTGHGVEKGGRVGRFLPSAKLRPSQDPDPLRSLPLDVNVGEYASENDYQKITPRSYLIRARFKTLVGAA